MKSSHLLALAIALYCESQLSHSQPKTSTSGNCSPIVSNTSGNVSITCKTIASSELSQINTLLVESKATREAARRIIELLEDKKSSRTRRVIEAESLARQMSSVIAEINKLRNELHAERARDAARMGDVRSAEDWVAQATKRSLARIETRIEIDHLHLFLWIDNDIDTVKQLRGRDDVQVRASSNDYSALSDAQRDLVKQFIRNASKSSFYFFEKSIETPNPGTGEHSLAMFVGKGPDYENVDVANEIRWGLISWPNPKQDIGHFGWTYLDLRVPAKLVRLLPGRRSVGSFSDLAGSKVVAWIGPPGTMVVYARIISRTGVHYPIYDTLENQTGRMLAEGVDGLFRTTISEAPPWLPE